MFSLADAHTLDEVITAANEGRADKLLIPVSRLFDSLPEWRADEECERRIKCGNDVKAPEIPDSEYRVYSKQGEFLMLGRAENGIMKTVKSFFEVS